MKVEKISMVYLLRKKAFSTSGISVPGLEAPTAGE